MIEIPLTQGQTALVDDDRADLAALKWFAEKREQTYYASRNKPKIGGKNQGVIRLHTAVMGVPPPGMEIDHVNRNGLDCRRENLRFVTSKQNHGNRGKCQTKTYTRFKGVYWHKRNERWWSQIGFGGTSIRYLGQFATEEEAARAYDAAARERYGEFARLNFPDAQAA